MAHDKKNWVSPTKALWLQWRLDFAQHLQGVTLQYQRYRHRDGSSDHDHCAACWVTLAEFDGKGIEREGYATCEDYAHGARRGARYDWVCRNCFDDLKEFMGWKLVGEAAPGAPLREIAWEKGKLPRIECLITFLLPEEGGRSFPPQYLSGNQYRPHLVIREPNEEYIGVAFNEGPAEPEAGQELSVVLTLIYFPNSTYGELRPGTDFTVREGAKIVGHGTVRRWLD
jgi:hypothetical protein